MRLPIALSLAFLFIGLPAAAESPADYLPKDPVSKPEIFVGQKLFDYMNGGAELYLAYGFVDIAVQAYQTTGNQVTVEIYRMGGPYDAFGIFSHASKGRAVDVGIPAVLARGMLSFFKGRFYVRVVAKSDPQKAKDLMVALGRRVAAAVPGEAQSPQEVSLLPEGSMAGSLRYLVNPETARTVWFDGEGALILTKRARAVTAFYPGGDSDIQATRVAYPDKAAAKKACRALGAKLSLKTAESGGECTASGKTQDDVFAAVATKDRVLRWVTGASDQKSTADWLAKVK
jgi:hypothetical protein